MPAPEKFSIWIPVKLVAVPVAAGLVTILAERNAPRGRAIGYWIGLMLVPALLALAAVRLKPIRRMRTFSTVFCVVSLLGLFAVLGSIHNPLFGPKKTAQDIVQEAAGIKPVTESGSASDRLLREFMSDVLAARKKHDEDMEPLMPALAAIYTVQSFSSKQQMEDMVSTLKKAMQADGELFDKLQQVPQDVKARVDAADLSASEKEDIMRGFQQGYGKSEIVGAYREVRSSEEQWVGASVDLYSFGVQHTTDIKIKDKKIVLANSDLLAQFNAKLKTSRDLRKNLVEANQHLVKLQADAMQKTGISKSDLGLK